MRTITRALARLTITATAMTAGCTPDKDVEFPGTEGMDTSGDPSGDPGGDPSGATDTSGDSDPTDADPSGDPEANREVDILFVIDNSNSMSEEQALLVSGLAAFVDVLEAPDFQADYRIAVTTTDSGNPRCPSATYKPEGGKFVLSSCLDRVAQNEFTVNGEDYSFACMDHCSKGDGELTVTPTVGIDGAMAPRSWVERIGGVSNIEGASTLEALQCYLPQGVAGCGFESHLESMYLALAQANVKDSPTNYGFLRETAQLAVIIVSDETDCSYNPATKDIFVSNKVFWSDPEAPAPTSALCWNAGVACAGGPGTYSECHAENYDISGSPGASDAEAALQPVGKYVDFVKNIEAQKQNSSPGRRVKVALITGVPAGYDSSSSELVYQDSADQFLQDNYGIGPGCVVGDPQMPDAFAVPPVRERELAEAFAASGQRNLYSICQQDYSATLEAIALDIRDGV